MSVLPVAQRELRLAARQGRTYLLRLAAALVAFVVVAYASGVSRKLGIGGGGGRSVFFGLVHLAAWICILAGARLTADAISREKRDGTLGFLFLSHLSGLDVVVGKLLAQATYAFYALLATIPILAIPFLDGGVQPGEFWFAMLALTNTLFFSVCLGLLTSSVCREPRRASGLATGAALFFWLGLPGLAALAGAFPVAPKLAKVGSLLLCLSPASTMAFDWGVGPAPSKPWFPLLGTHGLAWGFLLVAAEFTRRAWRERPAGKVLTRSSAWWRDFTMGRPSTRAARRAAALDRSAFLWLLVRRRWKPLGPWFLVLAVLALIGLVWLMEGRTDTDSFYAVLLACCFALHVLFKFLIAGESVSALVAHRRAGTLELLLTTPLNVQDIMRAQFLAAWRQFGLALIAVALVTMGSALLYRSADADSGDTVLWLAGGATLALGADAITLIWLGTWRSISTRRVHHAAGSTAFRVLVLPWLVLCLLVPFFAFKWGGPGDGLLLWALVGFGSDLLWWIRSRQQLLERFRPEAERASSASKSDWLDQLAKP